MGSPVDAASGGELDVVLGHLADLTATQRSIVTRRHELIPSVAAEVGAWPVVVETKWGQPSFRSPRRGESTPLRIGVTGDGGVALLAHCPASVMSGLRDRFGAAVRFDGNRGVLFDEVRPDLVRTAIEHALTYGRVGPPADGVRTGTQGGA